MANQQVSLESLKEIPSLAGYYVDMYANVYSIRRTALPKKLTVHSHKVAHSNKEYIRVKVNGRLWLVHRLMAMVKYSKELDVKETVNHINGITTDNSMSNLEIATHHEQVAHAVQSKLYCSGKEWYEARGLSWQQEENFRD